MDTVATAGPAPSGTQRGSRGGMGRFHGLGPAGFTIVTAVAVITSLNTTVKFLVTRPLDEWFSAFVVDLRDHAIIGLAILLAAVWVRNRVPERGARQYAAAALAVTLATAATIVFLQVAASWGDDEPLDLFTLWVLGADLVRYSFLGLVITSAWLYVRAEADHVAVLQQCAVDVEQMDRQTAEARLQMLEAQIEPHFLFNTLANLRRLYETDRVTGARMLGNLKDYLAVALPDLRSTESTLGREVDHATAYLNIQQVRMNRRLAFATDVPPSLRSARMPSLMVLTLVENAIKHGLAPMPEGGRIDVTAALEGDRLQVRVADTGRGFGASEGGGGTGLANTRARLASYYGARASLTLAANEPKGVVATIAVPYEPTGPQPGAPA